MQKMPENIYCNTVQRTKTKSTEKACYSEVRGSGCIVVLFVSLFLSLVANAVLVCHYGILGCEPVTNCSDPEPEHNAQNIWIHPKDRKHWTAAQNCPEKDFTEKWWKYKGSFYVFSTDVKNWTSSRERCQELGGDLVIIESSNEQELLAERILEMNTKALYWSGLTDSHIENDWRWVDSTHLDKRLNSLWASEPDNFTSADYPEGEDCVVLNGRIPEAKWGDVSCLRKERRICEILCG